MGKVYEEEDSFFVLVVCVLYNILKNSEFPVWNDFQFCFIARQVSRVKKKISLLFAHVQSIY